MHFANLVFLFTDTVLHDLTLILTDLSWAWIEGVVVTQGKGVVAQEWNGVVLAFFTHVP